jgi:hypothetical protein
LTGTDPNVCVGWFLAHHWSNHARNAADLDMNLKSKSFVPPPGTYKSFLTLWLDRQLNQPWLWSSGQIRQLRFLGVEGKISHNINWGIRSKMNTIPV